MAGSTYLNADNFRVLQGACISVSKVLGDRHLPSVAKRKGKVVGPSGAHFLDDPWPAGSVSNSRLRTCGEDPDPGKETLELHSLAIGQASARGQYIGIIPAEELHTEIKEVSGLIHHTGRDVDVDQHAADCWTDRLKISAPKHKAAADVPGLSVSKERSNVERVVGIQGGFHPDDDILHEWRQS